MKRVFYLLFFIFSFLAVRSVHAQDVFDPADPDVIFTKNNQWPRPANYVMAKWGHSKLLSWNSGSYGFKSYFYTGVAFRLKYPANFDKNANDGKKYACYVFMHGAGEVGGIYDNDLPLIHGSQTHANHVDNGDFDGFLLYPQGWSEFATGLLPYINNIIDSLVKYAKVDRDRVIIGGLSSGGSTVMNYVNNSPATWAVATPISPVSILNDSEVKQALSIPMWVSNGGLDTKPAPNLITRMVDSYKNYGGDIRQNFYPNSGHGVWNDFWASPGYFDYIKNAHKAQPVVKYQHNEWCPDETIRTVLILQPGFYQYEWQKDGVTIPGATKDSLVATEFGTYRGRFKRKSSSDWSDWSPRPIVVASKGITVTPPITIDGLRSNVLPAPDGSVTVPLKIPEGYASYEWRRVSDGSLVSTTNTLDAAAGQYKVRVTEQFGCSSVFSEPFTVVAANGPGAPEKVTEVTAVSTGNTQVEVFWNEKPNPQFNETAFEIYRSQTSGKDYNLVGIIPADSSLFVDNNLLPNTTYYYIVRAVNQNAASPVSNEASVKTLSDNRPPSTPPNLTVAGITRHSVSLAWSPSTDDVGIKYYEVYVDGQKAYNTPKTEFTVNDLDSFKNVSFYVRAVDLAGNPSAPSAQVTAFTKLSGLSYRVYEGDWNALPDFSELTPVKLGLNPNIDLAVRPAGLNDYFGMVWEGWINITTAGKHTFYLTSDDGSALYLDTDYSPDAVPLINNDGLHGSTEKSASITLSAGWHKIAITFFEKTGGEVLTLYWKRPTGLKVKVPDNVFSDSQNPPGGTPGKPSNVNAQATAYNLVQISWQDNSSNETGFEIYRKASSEANYVIVGSVGVNVTSFNDSTTAGATAYTYRVQAINVNGASGYNGSSNVTTPAAPPVPATPEGLTLEVLSSHAIKISFTASGHTGFEIMRSTQTDEHFRIFKIVDTTANEFSIVDSGLYSNTLVYYKVRALGVSGNSGYCDEESSRTLNTPPVLNELGTKYAYFSGTTVIPVSASDADGDNLQITLSGVPAFATFDSTGVGRGNLVVNPGSSNLGLHKIQVTVSDGFGGIDTKQLDLVVTTNRPPSFGRTGNIQVNEGQVYTTTLSAIDLDRGDKLKYYPVGFPTFVVARQLDSKLTLLITPGYADAGVYPLMVLVSDGFGGVDTARITLTVNDVDPTTQRIFMNVLGGNPAPESPWNNLTSANTSNLIDEKGNVTAVTLSFTPTRWATSSLGTTTGNNSGILPDLVMRDNLYFGVGGVPDVYNFQFTGLVPNSTYKLSLFAASSYSGGKTVYESNGQTQEIDVANNTTKMAVFNKLESDASGMISVKMSKGAGATIGYLNALILELPYDDGTIPRSPVNFSASTIENGNIRLAWKNIAYNATGYKILRADAVDGTFAELNVANGSDSSYVDTLVTGNSPYFYKIYAFNDHGNSDTVGIAQATTPNRAPVLERINSAFMKAGATQTISITATDNPEDILTLKLEGLPSFANFESTGNGTGIIHLNPAAGNVGLYKDIVAIVTDNYGASDSARFNISVSDNSSRTVLINFNGNEAAPWNNFTGNPNSSTTMSGIVDDLNATTPFTFKFTTSLYGKSVWGMKDANQGIFSDEVLNTAVYANNTSTQTMRFANLDPAKKYNVVILSSFNSGGPDSAYFTSGAKSIWVNGRYNSNKTEQLNGLSPATNGTLDVNFTKSASSEYFMLNAVKLEEYDDGNFLNPINLVAEPLVSNTSVTLKWSDRTDSETGFEIYRSTSPNSGYSLIATTAADVTTYVSNGLTPGTAYYFKVRAKKGSDFSDYSNATSFITAKSLILLNMNIPGFAGPSPWNNTNDPSSDAGATVENLINTETTNTGIDFMITKAFNGKGFEGPNISTGVFPALVMRSNYWTDAGQVSAVKFSGLDFRKTYRVGIFSSVVEVRARYFGLYTINGVTKPINGQSNDSKIIYFDNIRPDENGEIHISVTPDVTWSPYCFTNAFTLEGYTVPAGYAPTAFRELENAQQSVIAAIASPAPVKDIEVTATSIGLSAFPNPFVSEVRAEIQLPAGAGNAQLEMFDIHSRLIFKKEIGNGAGIGYRNTVTLPVDKELAPGVYTLRLTAGSDVKVIRLVKGN